MESAQNNPPRIALAFFRWFCRAELQEEIEGDLMEQFYLYSEKYGPQRAKWLFLKEVLLLFRPSILQNIFQLTYINSTIMTLQNKRLISILAGAAALLFVPLVAMKFTDEVKWTLIDFLVAGILLFGAGLTLEIILRKIKKVGYRIVFAITLFIVLFLIWAELAVGIFGTPFAGN